MKLSSARVVSVFFLCAIFAHTSQANGTLSLVQQAYLDMLIKNSLEQGLAGKRMWHILLHYRRNSIGTDVTSEVDDPGFFLAKSGKTDPQGELEATLTAFFSDGKTGKKKHLPQCEYPARFRWLDSMLDFDRDLMPEQNCEALDRWRELINAGSASLIFSSYHFNNPASMFGHTLLRINSADDSRPGLLDFAISYAADIEGAENFFDYVWNGLSGGFKGRFTVYPYYDMVKLYNDLENRDLWEYRLNLSPGQVDFMLLHAWELVNTHFDFYFMRENCSYHLLSLLEVANPELNYRDEHRVWTLPAGTLKQVSETPGMVTEIVRRPSLRSQLERQMRGLNMRELEHVKKLVRDHEQRDSEELSKLPYVRHIAVLDTAISLSQYQSVAGGMNSEKHKSTRHNLMVQRSKLGDGSNEVQSSETYEPLSPDQGHDPFRLAILSGYFQPGDDLAEEEKESFIELTIQPGYHDLLSREDGHAPNTQLRFLALSARYGEESEEWQIQEFALMDLISLNPISEFIKELSWKLDTGWERNRDGACADCTPFALNPGVGIAAHSSLYRKVVYYGFLEANFEFDHELDNGRRGGLGASVGLLFDAAEQWRVSLTANRTYYSAGGSGYVTTLGFEQRIYISRNLEITFDLKQFGENKEGRLGMSYYF